MQRCLIVSEGEKRVTSFVYEVLLECLFQGEVGFFHKKEYNLCRLYSFFYP